MVPRRSLAPQRILYVHYANPAVYPPLQHSSRLLAAAGWQVLMIGTGTHGADALTMSAQPGLEVRCQPYCPPGWRQKLSYVFFVARALGWSLRWRPGWIYASDPMSAPAVLLPGLFSRHGLVYHEHDSPNPDSGGEPSTGRARVRPSAFLRFILWARRLVARRATVCVLPNAERASWFRNDTATRRPIVCVWNCPARAEADPTPAANTEGLVLFYHGSLVPARLPAAVIHALALLPDDVRLRVAGYETIGHPGYIDSLRQLAGQLGVGSRVEYLGPVPLREHLLQECRRAQVGLAFMPKNATDVNERAMTGASNKPFDYLACGLALLVSDLPDWRKMFVDGRYGLACDPHDPASIAAAVRWLASHPQERQEMGRRGRARILADWNYEAQFTPVQAMLESRTSPDSGAGAPPQAFV